MTVVRTESVLAAVAVEYYIEPNGDAKFYGGASVIYFLPGEAVRHVTVIAKDDGVPQVSCAVSVPSVSPQFIDLCRSDEACLTTLDKQSCGA